MGNNNKLAMNLAIIAGILLFLSGISGYATWNTIRHFVLQNIADNTLVQIVFAILVFIASLGGIAVILGGIFIGKNNITTGKLFIMLGAGVGIIGLLVSLIITFMEGSLTLGSFFSIGIIGIILSIIARKKAKK